MKYLITFYKNNCTPFLTNYFDFENNFVEGMIIYNTQKWTYSTNGRDFKEIELDHL